MHIANGVVWEAVSPRVAARSTPRVVREIPALRANLRIARRRERALRRVRCRARLRGGVRIVRFGPPPARLPDAAVGSPRDRVLRVEGPSFKGVRSGVERRRGRVLKEARDHGGRRDAPRGEMIKSLRIGVHHADGVVREPNMRRRTRLVQVAAPPAGAAEQRPALVIRSKVTRALLLLAPRPELRLALFKRERLAEVRVYGGGDVGVVAIVARIRRRSRAQSPRRRRAAS